MLMMHKILSITYRIISRNVIGTLKGILDGQYPTRRNLYYFIFEILLEVFEIL